MRNLSDRCVILQIDARKCHVCPCTVPVLPSATNDDLVIQARESEDNGADVR